MDVLDHHSSYLSYHEVFYRYVRAFQVEFKWAILKSWQDLARIHSWETNFHSHVIKLIFIWIVVHEAPL